MFFKGKCWLALPVLCMIYTSSKHGELSVGCKSEFSLLKGPQNHGMVRVGTDLRDHLRLGKNRDRMHLPSPEMWWFFCFFVQMHQNSSFPLNSSSFPKQQRAGWDQVLGRDSLLGGWQGTSMLQGNRSLLSTSPCVRTGSDKPQTSRTTSLLTRLSTNARVCNCLWQQLAQGLLHTGRLARVTAR